jgi:hypothetical protein
LNYNNYILNSVKNSNKKKLTLVENFKNKKKIFFYKTINIYFNKYGKIFKKLNFMYKNIFVFKFNLNYINNMVINKLWFNSIKLYFPIRFSESSVTKNINYNNLKNFNFFYIRKNRIFNKGRYSRNRQLYRTGVYWCL